MRSSHNKDGVDPDIAKIGPNKADISGAATGESSDALNDRLGRPREGQISPAGPAPHFVTLRVDNSVPPLKNETVIAYAAWSPKNPDYVAPAAFEPVLADMQTVVIGWLPDTNGKWHAIEAVRSLSVEGGRVMAKVGDEEFAHLADFGTGPHAVAVAEIYRARIAHYISSAKFDIPDSYPPQ